MFAQIALRGWSLGELLVLIIVLVAVAGIFFIALRAMGVPLPQWALQILGIIVVAVVAILERSCWPRSASSGAANPWTGARWRNCNRGSRPWKKPPTFSPMP